MKLYSIRVGRKDEDGNSVFVPAFKCSEAAEYPSANPKYGCRGSQEKQAL